MLKHIHFVLYTPRYTKNDISKSLSLVSKKSIQFLLKTNNNNSKNYHNSIKIVKEHEGLGSWIILNKDTTKEFNVTKTGL